MVSLQLLNMKRPLRESSFIKFTNKKLELSDAEVQLEMGRRFFYGLGVPKDDDEALKWFLLSAEQGNAKAQNRNGIHQCQSNCKPFHNMPPNLDSLIITPNTPKIYAKN